MRVVECGSYEYPEIHYGWLVMSYSRNVSEVSVPLLLAHVISSGGAGYGAARYWVDLQAELHQLATGLDGVEGSS